MKTGNGHNQPVLPVEKNYYHPPLKVAQLKVSVVTVMEYYSKTGKFQSFFASQ